MPFSNLDSVVAEVTPLAQRFEAAGHQIYLVGGIVRDLWLDRDVGGDIDLDLTTDARPSEIKALIGPIADALWLQGERFGTVGALMGDRAYEITTHRAEAYVADSRKPAVEFSAAIDEDLSRRDFTINSMAVQVPGAELVDPFDGTGDLSDGLLRTPLDAEISFADDPLRMLRAARFVAAYGLLPSPQVSEAMASMGDRLEIVSAERIRDELDKLLSLPDPGPGLVLLADTGLLYRFLPEVGEERLTTVVPAVVSLAADPELRLAGLLFGVGAEAVRSRMGALKHSTDRRRATEVTLRAASDLEAGLVTDPPSMRRWVARSGGHRFDARSLVSELVPGGPQIAAASLVLEHELGGELADLSPPLTGAEVMDLLQLEEGPAVGQAMTFLQELRFDRGQLSGEDARRHLVAWWSARSEG